MAILKKPVGLTEIHPIDDTNDALTTALKEIDLTIQTYNLTPQDRVKDRKTIITTLCRQIENLQFSDLNHKAALGEIKEMLQNDDAHPDIPHNSPSM